MEDMASHLTSREEQAVKEFIETVNDLRLRRNAGPLSWNTAVKFMMARKFDVHRALALYEVHEITRVREGLIRFDPINEPLKSELETGKFTVLPTRDSTGAAIAIFTANKHFPIASSHQVTLQGLVYQLDVSLHSVDTQRCGIIFIYNMIGSKYVNFDYELCQKILSLLKGAYPARLKKVLIVAAPLWFKAPFKILRLFVREKLRERVFMVNVPQLSLHVPIASLPRELGGIIPLDHNAWILHCLKSNTNCNGDLCDISSLPTSPSSGMILYQAYEVLMQNGNSPLSDGETDEPEDFTSFVHEKHNSEKREKEVEVLKKQDTVQSPCLSGPDILLEERNGINDPILPSANYEEDLLEGGTKTDMTLEEFIQHLCKLGRKGLYEEYADIKSKSLEGTFNIARLKHNQPKNRYSDVLCYDHSRVKLMFPSDDPSQDYINANYVDGFQQKNAFISTQGPLPKTFPDFWQMVWEQEVLLIVMTTRTIERSRAKCGQYWPKQKESSAEYGEFHIFNNGVEHFKDYVVTQLVLTNLKTDISRVVVHMQFISWPDYGVPHSALAMLTFCDKVREQQVQALQVLGSEWKGHPLGPPIIVHCSAGIGRTGTFITLDSSIQQLEATGTINVRGTVERIRFQRAHSIQMPDQYVFCHLALLEYALSRGLLQDVDLSGFDDSDSESE
ncbi:tyrosine-protein phosphatase non-receptor type 9-like isoform X2 [Limulus polyphemus]|uniref:Tyrosine-protein phosphatase non-receptor type 9-like isoform X2 n=1 Tax=Limulus polyphemus TaxID=6850 RepID=A0ABM1SKY3_LIMPO|nr:tyrosine-protein phosphatase non-receptor type 9-like isoform X2 [Limulus polyphemus]